MSTEEAPAIPLLSMDDIAQIHATILSDIYHIFDEKIPKPELNTDQLKLALFARILCGADSINSLTQKRMFTYIPIVLRSMLEARVSLINLYKNKDNVRRMAHAFAVQEEAMLSEAIKCTGFAEQFKEGSISLSRLRNARAYINDNASFKKQKISKQFKKAGLYMDYFMTYNELCRSTHNNIDKLISDHFAQDGSVFVVHADPDTTTFTSYMFISSNICLHSAMLISSLFNVPLETFTKAKGQYLRLQSSLSQ